MKLIIFLLAIFFISTSGSCYNDNELILTIDLIRELNIRQLIFSIEDYSSVNICYLKFFSFYKTSSIFMTRDEITSYVLSDPYVNMKTMIVYTEVNEFNELQDLSLNLTLEVRIFLMSKFTWLTFSNDDIGDIPFFLSVPYDCQFIIASAIDESSYKLTEIYNIKIFRIEVDYGTWDTEHGLNVSKKAIYFRRSDMRQIEFTALLPDYQCDMNETYRTLIYSACHYAQLLKDITKHMNFDYDETTRQVANMYPKLLLQIDAFQDVHIFNDYYQTYLKYLPMHKLQLYIKYPEEKLMEGYYYLPFNNDTWYAILIIGIAGGIFCIFAQYIYRNYLKTGRICHSQELVYIAFNIFCSQGIDDRRKTTFRIAFITLRFLALMIASTYSADLMSYLSIRIPNIPFTSLDTFIENGEYKMLLPMEDIFIFVYFNDSKSLVLQRIAKNLSSPPSEDNVRLQKLCSHEKFALPTYGIDNSFGEAPCHIYRIPKIIAYHFYGIMLGSEGTPSSYSRILNNYFLRFREAGIFKEIEDMTTVQISEPTEDLRAIELNQAVQLFQIVVTGSVFSLLVFFCEIFVYIVIKCVKNIHRMINDSRRKNNRLKKMRVSVL